MQHGVDQVESGMRVIAGDAGILVERGERLVIRSIC